MTDSNAPKGDRIGNDYSRGPNPDPGGEIDTGESAVPPYEGRTTESTNSRDIEATAGEGDGVDRGTPEPVNPQVAAPAPADPSDLPPAGVGETSGRRGEDIQRDDGKEAGRREVGTQGEADRPVGTSDPRDQTGI